MKDPEQMTKRELIQEIYKLAERKKLKGVYEEYKHMDKALSDRKLISDFTGQIRFDLWLAIKEELGVFNVE